jgi:hypothetical protein
LIARPVLGIGQQRTANSHHNALALSIKGDPGVARHRGPERRRGSSSAITCLAVRSGGFMAALAQTETTDPAGKFVRKLIP